jgi:hypothetical protein
VLDVAVFYFVLRATSPGMRWLAGAGLALASAAVWVWLCVAGWRSGTLTAFASPTGMWLTVVVGPSSLLGVGADTATPAFVAFGVRACVAMLLAVGYARAIRRANLHSPLVPEWNTWNRAALRFVPGFVLVVGECVMFALAAAVVA